MEKPDKISFSALIKWTRITGIVLLALLLVYLAGNFRIFSVPDGWVHLHPVVLPGEKWLYKHSHDIYKNLYRGNLAVFTGENDQGAESLHVSMTVGFPGEQVEYDPEKREFRVNDVSVPKDFSLAGEWLESPCELTVLGEDEYMLIDNNALPDDKRIWIVKRENLFGKFLFKLPF